MANSRIICSDKLLNDRYLCCICSDVYKKPCNPNNCYHVFCLKCLIDHTKITTAKCPVCKIDFDVDEILIDSQLSKEIEGLDYQCQQCVKTMSLIDLNKHRETCKVKITRKFQVPENRTLPTENKVNRVTFVCPFCNQANFDVNGLRNHLNENHRNENQHKVCPICSSMPWGNPGQISQNLLDHVNLRHKFEYDTFVDYNQEEEIMFQLAIKASLQSN